MGGSFLGVPWPMQGLKKIIKIDLANRVADWIGRLRRLFTL